MDVNCNYPGQEGQDVESPPVRSKYPSNAMQALLKAIRDREVEKVKALIEKDPQLVQAAAKEPSKKDHGQSPRPSIRESGQFRIR
jgi:hypothetical protein